MHHDDDAPDAHDAHDARHVHHPHRADNDDDAHDAHDARHVPHPHRADNDDDTHDAHDADDADDADDAIGDRLVNRQVLFLLPLRPYSDWANGITPAGGAAFRADRTGTAYLIPLFDDDEHTEGYVAEHFDSFFAEELSAWDLDESTWPAPRTFAMFLQWFDARIAPLVFDAGAGPIRTLHEDDDTDDPTGDPTGDFTGDTTEDDDEDQ